MRNLRVCCLGAILASIALTAPPTSGTHIRVAGCTIPYGSGANSMAVGPDGTLWFTGFTAGYIGQVTTTGQLTRFPVSNAFGHEFDITEGSEGAMWFTAAGGVGRIDLSGAVTPEEVSASAGGIVAGPDGALCFPEDEANEIGRLTAAGDYSEYPVPSPSSAPTFIAVGADGARWFTATAAGQVGRITTDGAITEYPLGSGSSPEWIAAGPDGALRITGGKAAFRAETEAGPSMVRPWGLGTPRVVRRVQSEGAIPPMPRGYTHAPPI